MGENDEFRTGICMDGEKHCRPLTLHFENSSIIICFEFLKDRSSDFFTWSARDTEMRQKLTTRLVV